MANGKITSVAVAHNQSWDQKLIFSTLADQARYGLLRMLGRNGPQTAAGLVPAGLGGTLARLSVNRIVKSLGRLQKAGLVVVIPHPTDGRKQLYSLAPGIAVTKTETNCHLDLGFCLLRL